VAAESVLGVPDVQSSFLDHLSATEARETGTEAGRQRRTGQETAHHRGDTG
jgi:hypothetical protein